MLQSEGVYRCDFERSNFTDWREQYDWLAREMKCRIGNPPKGVHYPFWAWYMKEGRRKKPDFRRERWENGWRGERLVCMEVDIPDSKVLLSDFDDWSMILLNGLISDSEEEDGRMEKECESLPSWERQAYRHKNWERAFSISPLDNDWVHRGDTIQATFWELRKECIRKAWFFTAARKKPESRRIPLTE